MLNAIEVKNLTKRYDDFTLDNINFNLEAGTMTALIGENGAGKTTLIKAILGMIKPTSGEIKVLGNDITVNGNDMEHIGVVLDGMTFPTNLKIKYIDTVMKDMYINWDSKLFYDSLKKFNLKETLKIKELSTGMKKKLEIIVAFSSHPKLLILDEPTNGLDPVVRSEVYDVILDFLDNEQHSVLLSTHITSDVEKIADKIVFVNKGKILLDKDRDTVLDTYGILRCNKKVFETINKQDMIAYKENKYEYEVLVADKTRAIAKYKDAIIDAVTLDELMVIMIKGTIVNGGMDLC